MTYDEFKQNFLPDFLNITSFAGKIRYANEHLVRIGSGTGRIVYDIDGERVLKLGKNAKGIAQNEAEADTGFYDDTKHIVTQVFDSANNDEWLISEKGKKVTKKRIEELTGIPSLNDLYYYLRNFKSQNNGRGKIYNQSEEISALLDENEFSQDLQNFIGNYNQFVGDMGRPSSYGEVLRDGQPTIVLTDYGLNDEVYDTHYSPNRKQKYQMYELYNYADGNDDILSDAGGGNDIRTGMWAQMPYSVSDGGDNSNAVINEEFIDFVSNCNTYPDAPISNLPILTDHFHDCVNNISEILRRVENKKQFYNNLLELQTYLTEQGYYNRDQLTCEEYVISEDMDIPDVELYSLEDKNYGNELANNVAGKLGLTAPRYLGGGANGFAYEINDNLVMKLTADISEADAAAKLLRGRPQYIATIFNLYKVIDNDINKTFFVIMQENVNDKPLAKFRKFENDIETIQPAGMGFGDILSTIRNPKRFDYNNSLEVAKHILSDNPEVNIGELDRKAAYDYVVGILNIRKELIEFEIKSRDYIEVNNLGYKDGVLKFFDTGGYYGVSEPNISDTDIISLPEDGSAKFSTDSEMGQDGFPAYDNTADSSPSINNSLDANIAMYEDLEYKHVDGDATDDQYMIGEERKKAWMSGSKAVEVKKKCRLGGLGNTSVACNQGDINNLKFSSINEEDKQYLNYQEENDKLKRKQEETYKKIDDLTNNVKKKYFQKYTTPDDLQEIINDIGDWYPKQLAVFEKMSEIDNSDYQQEANKVYDLFKKAQKYFQQQKFNIDNKYKGKNQYGLKGDVNSRYLYHFTRTDSAISIIYDGYFMGGGESTGISTSTNKDLIKQVQPIFYHSNEYSQGTTYRNLSTCFVLDFNKIKADKIKYNVGGDDELVGTHFGEEEIKLYPSDNKLDLFRYLVKVIYDPSKESNKETENKLIVLLNEKNIQYFMKNSDSNSLKEIIDLEVNEYFSSLVPDMNENNIMKLNDLPFKSEVEKLGGKIYSVGGAVRDEFLGKDSKDLDILITGIPMDKLEELLSKYGKVNKVGASFGVLKFVPTGASEEIDIAIPRTETPTGAGGHKGFDVTSDHTLPIEDDLKRRDFSINAIAKDSEGNIVDPYGGQEDLKNKIIRVVNPEAFSDDPLRMLRAVQFASRFGFEIEPETHKLIKSNAARIKEIPPERILIEFDKVVKKGDKMKAAYLLKDLGLTPQIFGTDAGIYIGDEWEQVQTMGEFLWLLSHHLVEDIAEFYKNNLKGDIGIYKELKALQHAFNASEEHNISRARTAAHNVYVTSNNMLQSKILPEVIQKAANDLLSGKYPKSLDELAVNGNDLIDAGLKGKEIGDMLKTMLVKIYSDEARNNREELLSLVNQDNVMNEEYLNSEKSTWDINGEDVTIDFFVQKYNEWNNQGGEDSGYQEPSDVSVLEFLQNNYEDFSVDKKLNKELYCALTDRNVLNERDEKVEYGALMLFLDLPKWEEILININKDDIYEVDGEFGLETEPHITILYGFHNNVNADKVFDKYKENFNLKPIKIKTTKISIFETDEYDVVKIDVESKILSEMNSVMRELPSTVTFPKYHPHITIAYVKKGSGKKYVKSFEKKYEIVGNELIYSTKKEKKNKLKLSEKGILKEEVVKKISYSAVVLDDKSRTKLIQVFKPMIPESWEIISHHMTIKMGALEDGSPEKADMEVDKVIELNVIDYAIDDLVMAVGVEGYNTKNEKSHITIAVNHADGGKPFYSNKLTDWKSLGFPLILTGKVREEPQNNILNENLNKSKYSKTKTSLLRSKSIGKEMKMKIQKYLGGGSTYHEGGRVHGLVIPKVKGKRFHGVSLGADKNGFYVYTHRAASKSYELPDKITQKDINYIESTG